MRAKMDRKAYLSAEIMGGFRLRGTKGTYRVSNRVDLPFAGNCGNKWLSSSLGSSVKGERQRESNRLGSPNRQDSFGECLPCPRGTMLFRIAG